MDSRSNSTAPLSTTPLSSAFSTITPATTPPSLLSLLTAAPALGADLPPDSQPQKHERGASHLPPGLSHPAQPVQLQPPDNFAQVFAGVYRSSFPKRRNLEFLRDIGVKTILTLMLEEYPEANMRFYKENGMRFVQFGVSGNKEPFVEIDEDTIRSALEFVLDVRNHPLLIHCNKGKHRTGCLVGALRKVSGWALIPTLDEYMKFAGSKPRFVDQQFIEFFDVTKVKVVPAHVPGWAVFE